MLSTEAIFGIVSLMLSMLGLAFSVFVSHEFGDGHGLAVFCMTTLLLLLAMRVHRNWSGSQRRRDVVLLGLLTAGTIAALGGSVPRWYDAGLDRQQMAHVEAVEFERELQHDPAFNDVEIYVSPKQFYWLKGAVMTPADLERLNAMADASRHVLWNHDVRVIGEARSPDVVPSNR